VEGDATRPSGDERENHEAAVGVREALPGRELRREPVEDSEICLGRVELVHGHCQQVGVEVELLLLVDVVADPRAVREQVLDRHVVADEREVVAEERAGGGRELERAVLDEAHDRERSEALRAAREPEAGVEPVRDRVPTVREAPGASEYDLVPAVDTDDAREARLGGDRIQLFLERGHR
jgi:hypothetical protein